jgi:membrane-bound lytic murein transglycosylase D
MSSDEFIALNAAFPRKLIRSDTPVNLLVPVDKTDRFQRNLDAGNWDSWQPYAAQKGERPEAIARRFDVSLARLEEHNQFDLKRGKLAGAQTVLVPVKRRDARTTTSGSNAASAAPGEHEVKRGETLFGVARRYGLSVRQLAEANPEFDGNLRPGQVLRLPATSLPRQAAAIAPPSLHKTRAQDISARASASPSRYVIKRGDSLLAIAKRFDISVAEMRTWNPQLQETNVVRTGRSIFISPP